MGERGRALGGSFQPRTFWKDLTGANRVDRPRISLVKQVRLVGVRLGGLVPVDHVEGEKRGESAPGVAGLAGSPAIGAVSRRP